MHFCNPVDDLMFLRTGREIMCLDCYFITITIYSVLHD